MGRVSLGWPEIFRLGLVQSAIGAMVVLATSTLNRVMVIEMALPASLPAALVAWHYLVQLSRPRWGHGSDRGGGRTRIIVGGMALLGLGIVAAAAATVLMKASPWAGTCAGIVAFAMIGSGVSASGTSLLALLASRVAPERRPAAAATVWVMMIFGIVLTAGMAGHFLDPFSPRRLLLVTSAVALIAFILCLIAVWRVEARFAAATAPSVRPCVSFGAALRDIFRERLARDFTLFVFVSMLAYSAQELILEPFSGLVFGFSLGQSTQLAAFQHGGVLVGMVLVGLLGSWRKGDKTAVMKAVTALGCAASAAALVGLAVAGYAPEIWPLRPMVFALGLANGFFAVCAIGLMMSFAGAGHLSGAGMRMGVWGAAQASAFALGGFCGAAGLDVMRRLVPAPSAFATVFLLEGFLFLCAALLALRLGGRDVPAAKGAMTIFKEAADASPL